MELIDFQGLNCYHNCIVSVANEMGIPYVKAFARLWSETSFYFEPARQVFLTRHMIEDLERLGAKLVRIRSTEQKEEREKWLEESVCLIVGIDAFFLPWTPIFETGHGPHYFIAQKRDGKEWDCLDPTYRKEGGRITSELMAALAFDIGCLLPVKAEEKIRDAEKGEAGRILRRPLEWEQRVLRKLLGASEEEEKALVLTAKYVDALLSNRQMYARYLRETYGEDGPGVWFDDAYFSQWKILKNGCFKLALKRRDEALAKEVCGRFQNLVRTEKAMAKAILQK